MAYFERKQVKSQKSCKKLLPDISFSAQAGTFKHLQPVIIEANGIKGADKTNLANAIGLYTGEDITALKGDRLNVSTQIVVGINALPLEDLTEMDIAKLKNIGVYVIGNANMEEEA